MVWDSIGGGYDGRDSVGHRRSGGRCNSGLSGSCLTCVESLLHDISEAVEGRIQSIRYDDRIQIIGFAFRP